MEAIAVHKRGICMGKLVRWVAFGSFVTACAGIAVPACATPGQTLAQFHVWAAQHALLRGLVRTPDEVSGRPAFDLLAADRGIAWHFHATTSAGRVESEVLGVGSGGGEPGSTPIRHNGSGYGAIFLRSLYDTQSLVVTRFYRGKRFGYEVAAGFFTIETFPQMARDLAQLRTCVAHPGACNE